MKTKRSHTEHYHVRQPRSEPKLGMLRTSLRGHFFEFYTSSSVFSRTRVDLGTRLLVEKMVLPQSGRVLDLGCGYGPVGVAAATLNPKLHVVMVDVNKRAVHLAKKNAEHNEATNVEVRHGFLYEPVIESKFKAIYSNPPVSAGMHIVLAIVKGAPEHLEENGLFQLVVPSKIGRRRLPVELDQIFGNVEVLARKSGYRILFSKNLKT